MGIARGSQPLRFLDLWSRVLVVGENNSLKSMTPEIAIHQLFKLRGDLWTFNRDGMFSGSIW
jgi:hypothetical protein